jgi:hemerythrin-like domain-containing protein
MDFQKIIDSVKKAKSHVTDVDYDAVDLILEDHKRLKELIAIMKDLEEDDENREKAAEEFAIQLVAHAKPEEQVLYKAMKQHPAFRIEAFEGETEHSLADQLLEEIKRVKDGDDWTAKVKVIAELVGHHIKEEEGTILPHVKKEFSEELRKSLGREFLQKKVELYEAGGEDSPHEGPSEIH